MQKTGRSDIGIACNSSWTFEAIVESANGVFGLLILVRIDITISFVELVMHPNLYIGQLLDTVIRCGS